MPYQLGRCHVRQVLLAGVSHGAEGVERGKTAAEGESHLGAGSEGPLLFLQPVSVQKKKNMVQSK